MDASVNASGSKTAYSGTLDCIAIKCKNLSQERLGKYQSSRVLS